MPFLCYRHEAHWFINYHDYRKKRGCLFVGVCCSVFVCVLNTGALFPATGNKICVRTGGWGSQQGISARSNYLKRKTSIKEGVSSCMYMLLLFFASSLTMHFCLSFFRWAGCLLDISQVGVQWREHRVLDGLWSVQKYQELIQACVKS